MKRNIKGAIDIEGNFTKQVNFILARPYSSKLLRLRKRTSPLVLPKLSSDQTIKPGRVKG
ncbi:MAG: hypothetical protein H6Q72_4171 [Firmicutes bacterium]|nr:hypothetical protein [Bacillota bacterium]